MNESSVEAHRWKVVREKWLAIIAADAAVPFHIYKVAYFIAGLVDDRTHEVWPQPTKLAKAIGYRHSLVSNGINLLAERGYLIEVSDPKPKPQQHSRRYRAMVSKVNDALPE
jgi:hypothetical protein